MHSDSILATENLSMKFGGLAALDKVNIQIKKNCINALIGPNGAGKTTLFNCVTGFYKPTTGGVFFKNKQKILSLTDYLGARWQFSDLWSPAEALSKVFYRFFGGTHHLVKQGIVRTFQHTRLFMNMTVMENLLVAQHDKFSHKLFTGLLRLRGYEETEKRAVQVAFAYLQEFGLMEDANRLAKELPYGKQKKLEIVRALCVRPSLLCLDEPAAGLNNTETKELALLIKDICYKHRVTVFVIEHDMSLVMRISDYVIVMDSGSIIADGSPEAVKRNPKVLAAYLGEDYS